MTNKGTKAQTNNPINLSIKLFCIYTSPVNTEVDGRFGVPHDFVQGLYSYNVVLNYCRGFHGQLEDHEPNAVFQQNGAPPILGSYFILDMHFPGRWVRRDGPIPWPPRPPDIMPSYFFL
jgi:hypothetical protein